MEGLIRFVVSPEGVVTPDLAATLPGRGLWVTAERAALQKVITAKGFARAARRQVQAQPDLVDQVAELLARRTLQMLGFARKAGAAVAGREKAEALARAGKIGVLLAASDGAEDGIARLMRLAQAVAPLTYRVTWLSGAELSLAFGRENVIHAAIAIGRMAERFRIEADRLHGFRGKSG